MSAQTVDFANLSFDGADFVDNDADVVAETSGVLGVYKPGCKRRFDWLVCIFTGAAGRTIPVATGVACDGKGTPACGKRLPCI